MRQIESDRVGVDVLKMLLVDDEVRLLNALQRLISSQPDMRVVGCLNQADNLEATVAASDPTIVIIDHGMPGRDPFEAIRSLAASHPPVRAIVYSGQSGESIVNDAIEAKAWGWIDKLASPTDILTAIRRVGAGEMVFPA